MQEWLLPFAFWGFLLVYGGTLDQSAPQCSAYSRYAA